MNPTRFTLAATLALMTASAAAATTVHVRNLGDGNIACMTAVGSGVYISAQLRGNYNRLCAAALHHAGILSDVRGDFNDVDVAAVSGAITATVVRGDLNWVAGTARGPGTMAAVEVHGDGAVVNYDIEGVGTQLHIVVSN